ncbi:FecR family protein [Dyadobacter sp. SG02]|uniref:FecR family protein n=1 Tax=Dyadobacter sp. SG02 TaxID=1855291 RepID=UPI0008B60297|nr:FecR family protein [Dyadobacter sp. SG02]SEJ11146.1 FecR family protein [Dyadobacter sp. SG02]
MPLDPSDRLLQSLLENPAFRCWADGKCPGDNAVWEKWATEHENGPDILRQAIAVTRAVPVRDEHLTDEYIQSKVNDALQAAKRQAQMEAGGKREPLFPVFLSGWNVAASLLIVAGLCFALFRIYNRAHPAAKVVQAVQYVNAMKEVANTERPFKYVQLPDGSSVVLHRNSTLKYPQAFKNEKREVYLTGEAFFEVTKNPDQPFFVYAGELVAKVHGTSFSIKAIADEKEITVAVKTGKVSVFSEASPTLLLTSSQQATYERAHAKLVRSALKSPVLLNIPIENQEFTYSETPAAAVFDALGQAYGVNIAFDRNSLAHCSITATLGDEPLENKLKWLCTILEAHYTITEDSITITGNPCN